MTRARKLVVPKKTGTSRTVTPLIYYGGKSRDSEFIVSQFPPHTTFVDVFGGGGAISFAKRPSKVDVYNDIGNVSVFFKTLRDYGDELYEALYLTPFSREEFFKCVDSLHKYAGVSISKQRLLPNEQVDWARSWYTVIMESFNHSEKATSWKVDKKVNVASGFATHVEELPRFIERLRGMIIENMDFMRLLEVYDTPQTLFYLDPPYVRGTRGESARGAYVHEMEIARHGSMLDYLTTKLKGQAVVSMYPYPMYEEKLKDWRRTSITHPGAIKNSTGTTGDRVEVVWIKEFEHGLWSLLDKEENAETILP